jgi:hypothetical protein
VEFIRFGQRGETAMRDVHLVSHRGEDQLQTIGGVRIVIYEQDATRVLDLGSETSTASLGRERVRHREDPSWP